jgi:hypothetical protein
MLYAGIYEFLYPETVLMQKTLDGENKTPSPYEKIALGLILFIPGSYHTVVALFAC